MAPLASIWDTISRETARPRVSVVIPALNEAKNLPHIAERMPDCVDEIVFVNGNSTDNTDEVARELWPHAVHVHQTRKGKGNALACGFAAATGDIIVMIDADGSTDPVEIPLFVATLLTGAELLTGADFAKGSRFVMGGGSADITPFRRLGNSGLNNLVNALFPTTFTDLCYGYNALWRRALDVVELPDIHAAEPQWGDGFEIEALINTRVAAAGLQIAEVPSFEGNRIHGASNLNAVSDGLRVLRTIGHEFMRARAAEKRTRRLEAQVPSEHDGVGVPWALQLV